MTDDTERLLCAAQRMLQKHQWSATAYGAYGTTAPCCPECGGIKVGESIHTGVKSVYKFGAGHLPGCAIAEAIK